MCFFCNVPEPTEIYTYCHTLSLHDALPIFFGCGLGCCLCRWLCGGFRRRFFGGGFLRGGFCGRFWFGCGLGCRGGGLGDRVDDGRSEEHTSELQSLMRISYAVFCLKKKKQYNKSASIRSGS